MKPITRNGSPPFQGRDTFDIEGMSVDVDWMAFFFIYCHAAALGLKFHFDDSLLQPLNILMTDTLAFFLYPSAPLAVAMLFLTLLCIVVVFDYVLVYNTHIMFKLSLWPNLYHNLKLNTTWQ